MPYFSRIANMILFTPFDTRAVVSDVASQKLTEEEFLQKCYCQPRFLQKFEKKDMPQEDSNERGEDIVTDFTTIQNELFIEEKEYNDFLTWANNFDNYRVCTISGNAGTGKTTFINYLRHNDNLKQWFILDVECSQKIVTWISDVQTVITDYSKVYYKMYSTVLSKIRDVLFDVDYEEGDVMSLYREIVLNIASITDIYEKYYRQYSTEGDDLFSNLIKLFSSEFKFKNFFFGNDNPKEMVRKCAICLQGYFAGISNEKALTHSLSILLLLLCCKDKDQRNSKYIIVFDNIEKFISADTIFDKEVDDLRQILTEYTKSIYHQKTNALKKRFKFAMAIRSSTYRMFCATKQACDSMKYDLDLGRWYNIDQIINVKKTWYHDNNIEIPNTTILEQITGDQRICQDNTITGLKLFIDPLFNDNKRLIIDFVAILLENPIHKPYIEKYNQLWTEKTSLSKFAARSIFKGLLLHQLEEEDNLFEKLKTYSSGGDSRVGIGDARKILTYLYNHRENDQKDEDIPLTTVLGKLLSKRESEVEKYWKGVSNTPKIKRISDIIYYMDTYNRRVNDWVQFVDVQIRFSTTEEECSSYNAKVCMNDSDGFFRLLTENIRLFTLHLMPAGILYLSDIVSTFEFFSVRYTDTNKLLQLSEEVIMDYHGNTIYYAPLFALIPTQKQMKKYTSYEALYCYKIIKLVANQAEKCIERLVANNEDSIRLETKEGKSLHADRIVNSHTSYLGQFIGYIQKIKEGCTEGSDEQKAYEALIRGVRDQRRRYFNFVEKYRKNKWIY